MNKGMLTKDYHYSCLASSRMKKKCRCTQRRCFYDGLFLFFAFTWQTNNPQENMYVWRRH